MTDKIIYKNNRIVASPKILFFPKRYLARVVIFPRDGVPEKEITLEYIGEASDSRHDAVRIAHNLGRAYVENILC